MAFDASQWQYTVRLEGIAPSNTNVGQLLFINQSNLLGILDQQGDAVDFFAELDGAGERVRFSTDPNGANEIAGYILHIDKVAKTIIIVLRKPVYDIGLLDVYMHFKNAAANAYAVDATYGQYATHADHIGFCHFDDPVTGLDDVISATGSTPGNTIGTVNSVSGLISKAFRTNGASASIGVKGPCVFNPQSPFTVSCVVKFLAISATEDPYVWCFNTGNDSERLALGVDVSAGNKWKIFSSGETPGTGTSTVTTDVWYKLDVLYDGTEIHLYVNGELEYSVTPTGSGWQSQTVPSTFVAGGKYISDSDIVSQEVQGDYDLFHTQQSAKSPSLMKSEDDCWMSPATFWTTHEVLNRNAVANDRSGAFIVEAVSTSQLSGNKSAHSDINIDAVSSASIGGRKQALGLATAQAVAQSQIVANKRTSGNWLVQGVTQGEFSGNKQAFGTFEVTTIGQVRFERQNLNQRSGAFIVTGVSNASVFGAKSSRGTFPVESVSIANVLGIKSASGDIQVSAIANVSIEGQKITTGAFSIDAVANVFFKGVSSSTEPRVKRFYIQGVLATTTIQGVLPSTTIQGKI
ncbi:MAG: hypothetical protein Alis3KO_01110 [Aliiglaciecola sp.]